MKKLSVLLLLWGLSLCWAQEENFVKETPSGAQVWHQEEHREERAKIENRLRKIEAEINKLKKYRVIISKKENKAMLDNIEKKVEELEKEIRVLKNNNIENKEILKTLKNNLDSLEKKEKSIEEKVVKIENELEETEYSYFYIIAITITLIMIFIGIIGIVENM